MTSNPNSFSVQDLQALLGQINRPQHQATFSEFACKWEKEVCQMYKPAGRASTLSNLRKLAEVFGHLQLSDISAEMIQKYVSSQNISPKTLTNRIISMKMLWKSARAWGYVVHDPFSGLVMPRAELKQQPSFLPEQVREIIREAREPLKTMLWIVSETGLRGGEVVALAIEDVDTDARMIHVRRSAYQGQLQTPKTGNAVRCFPISQSLAEHVRKMSTDVPNLSTLLFPTKKGSVHDNGNVVKRGLKPVLRAAGADCPRAGLHAFRHANASGMASLGVPEHIIKERLGHSRGSVTERYTHSSLADHYKWAEAIGRLFDPNQ